MVQVANKRSRIGVTRWEDVPGESFQHYLDRIDDAGGEAVALNGGDSIDGLDGLVLTGGYDVAPERYGEVRHPKVKYVVPERDIFELALLEPALARDLPVLAICRGHQLLNVALGGRLLQHIEDRSHVADYGTEGYPSQWHTVRFEGASRLRDIIGAYEIEVNSRHHQAVTPEMLAPGLRAVAMAPDGLVEGIESSRHRWVVGVQWHPERPEAVRPHFAPRATLLFSAFIEEAGKVAQPT